MTLEWLPESTLCPSLSLSFTISFISFCPHCWSKRYSPDWTPPAPPVPVSPHAGGEAPSRCWTRLCSHPRQAAAGGRVVTSLQNVQHNLRHWNRFHNFNNKFSSVRSASTLRINGFHSTSHQPPNRHQLIEPQFPVSCIALCWWATAHSSWGGYPTKNAGAQSLHWKVR